MQSKYILFSLIVLLISCNKKEKPVNKLVIGGSNNYISDTTIFKIIDKGNVIERGNEGKFVFLNNEKPYGLTSESMVTKNQYIHILLRSFSYGSNINLACEGSWGKWYGNSVRFNLNKFGWANQHLYVKVPDTILNAKLRIYAYYFGGGDGAEINRLEIRILNNSPFLNDINDYCFMPLCVDLSKELKKQKMAFDSKTFFQKAFELDEKAFENSPISKKEFALEWKRREKKMGLETLFKNISIYTSQYPELN